MLTAELVNEMISAVDQFNEFQKVAPQPPKIRFTRTFTNAERLHRVSLYRMMRKENDQR